MAASAAETVAKKDDKKYSAVISRTKKQERNIEQKAIKKGLKGKLKTVVKKVAAPLRAKIQKLHAKLNAAKKDEAKVLKNTKKLLRRAKKKQVLKDAKLVGKAQVAGAEAGNLLDELKGQITPAGSGPKLGEGNAAVQGRIVFPAGVEHKDALGYVKLKRSDGSLAQMGVVSGGKFALRGVESGTYTAESALHGFEMQQEEVRIQGGNDVVIHMNRPLLGSVSPTAERLGEATRAKHTLQGKGQIYGAVSYKGRNGGEGEGAAPALGYVKLHEMGKPTSVTRQMAVVKDGTFKLSNLPSGSYTVETVMPGHPSQFHNAVVDETSQSPLQLEVVV